MQDRVPDAILGPPGQAEPGCDSFMPRRVNNPLLVTSLYDRFTLEGGLFSQMFSSDCVELDPRFALSAGRFSTAGDALPRLRADTAQGAGCRQEPMRLRARPKIFAATSFEEGMQPYERRRNHLPGVLSDSADAVPAESAGVVIPGQYCPRLLDELRRFMQTRLALGDFVFRAPDASLISRAGGLRYPQWAVPDECLRCHAGRDDLSGRLTARTEFEAAASARSILSAYRGRPLRPRAGLVEAPARRRERAP